VFVLHLLLHGNVGIKGPVGHIRVCVTYMRTCYIFYIFLDFVIGGKQFCPSDDICFPVDVSGDTMWPRKEMCFL
jgi:hypothetical protein